MPKMYRQNCSHCGTFYEGYGKKFCGPSCSAEGQTKTDEFGRPPDETIKVNLGEEFGHVAVAASVSIKTPEELFARSGVDSDVWELMPEGKVKKWDVPMKIKTLKTLPDGTVVHSQEPVVIECHYVAIGVRKRWNHTELPSPVVLKVTRPLRRKPSDGAFTSVHYSDVHWPNASRPCVNILYQILDWTNPGLVIDHGDLLDCEQISKYPKDPLNRTSLKNEIKMGAEHLGIVHGITQDAEHVWLEGNHEERMKRTIWALADQRQAGEILTLPSVQESLSWPSLLGIGELGWQTIPYPGHKLIFDRLIACHGEKVRAESGQSAKAEFNHYSKGGLSGHTHRVGEFTKRKYDGEQAWFELGCMCSISGVGYTNYPNWANAFAVITWSADRKRYQFERVRVHDGVAYFRGKRFEGNSTEWDLAREGK